MSMKKESINQLLRESPVPPKKKQVRYTIPLDSEVCRKLIFFSMKYDFKPEKKEYKNSEVLKDKIVKITL